MGKMRLCVFCAVFVAFFSRAGFSDSVLLKSGQKVEGKIIENTEDYVKLDFHGVELTYYKDEVASVMRGQSGNKNEVSPQMESLYQAYTSSLRATPKQETEKVEDIPLPVIPQAAQSAPAAPATAGTGLTQLPPEYQKMVQSILESAQGIQSAQGKDGYPMAGLPSIDLSQLPPEYQKMIKSVMAGIQVGKSGDSGKDGN